VLYFATLYDFYLDQANEDMWVFGYNQPATTFIFYHIDKSNSTVTPIQVEVSCTGGSYFRLDTVHLMGDSEYLLGDDPKITFAFTSDA